MRAFVDIRTLDLCVTELFDACLLWPFLGVLHVNFYLVDACQFSQVIFILMWNFLVFLKLISSRKFIMASLSAEDISSMTVIQIELAFRYHSHNWEKGTSHSTSNRCNSLRCRYLGGSQPGRPGAQFEWGRIVSCCHLEGFGDLVNNFGFTPIGRLRIGNTFVLPSTGENSNANTGSFY